MSVKLKESPAKIERLIITNLCDLVNSMLIRAKPLIETDVRAIFRAALLRSDVIQSILDTHGTLHAELGIEHNIRDVTGILDIWINSIECKINPVRISGKRMIGGLEISGIYSSYSDVLSSKYAEYLTKKIRIIPWLDWLLLRGTNVLIRKWVVSYDPKQLKAHDSRTGLAVMIRSEFSYELDPSFAGTADDNFLTRTIDKLENPITIAIRKNIKKAI